MVGNQATKSWRSRGVRLSRRFMIFSLLILVSSAGLIGKSAAEAKNVLGFHLVHKTLSPADLGSSAPPAGYELLKAWSESQPALIVETQPVLTGEHVASAELGQDKYTQTPLIKLTLTEKGASLFHQTTAANVARKIALVLDQRVLFSAIVREPIKGPEIHINYRAGRAELEQLLGKIRSAIRR